MFQLASQNLNAVSRNEVALGVNIGANTFYRCLNARTALVRKEIKAIVCMVLPVRGSYSEHVSQQTHSIYS